jgi:hypothetical protein
MRSGRSSGDSQLPLRTDSFALNPLLVEVTARLIERLIRHLPMLCQRARPFDPHDRFLDPQAREK